MSVAKMHLGRHTATQSENPHMLCFSYHLLKIIKFTLEFPFQMDSEELQK